MIGHPLVHAFLSRWGGSLAWHIAVSALVLGVLLLVTLVMPKAQARTRHALLLLGLVQLLVPGTLLLSGLGRAGIDVVSLLGLRRAASMARLVAPATAAGEARELPFESPREGRCLLALGWGAGVLALAALGVARRRRGRENMREATSGTLRPMIAGAAEAASLRSVPRVLVGDVATPRVIGWLHPRLVLPEGLDARLEPRELQAVLAHELAHVARRDTLARALASVIATLAWFNPLVWVARRRLADEAEQACDARAAVQVGAQAYVDSLRRVCAAALTGPVSTVACMSSRRLAHRVELVLARPGAHRGGLAHRLSLAITVLLVLASGLGAAAWAARNDPPPTKVPEGRFELAGTVRAERGDHLVFEGEVTERTTHEVMTAPRIVFQGQPAMTRSTGNGLTFELRLVPTGSVVAADLEVREGDKVLERHHLELAVPTREAKGRYELTGTVKAGPRDSLTFEGDVAERSTHESVMAPRIVFAPDKPAQARTTANGLTFELRLMPTGSVVAADLEVREGDKVLERHHLELSVTKKAE
jgi:beta-lactamase regulating signal transducer with metallopeptidase domain